MKKFVFLVLMAFLLSGFAFGQNPAIHVTEEGNVSIGSWSTASKFHVWGGGILTDSYYGFYGGNFTIPESGSFMAVENTRGNLVFYQNGGPQLTIGSFGDEALIGIGTGSGQQDFPLHIKGNRSVNPILKLESTSTGSFIEYRTEETGGYDFWHAGVNGPYPDRFWFAGTGYGASVFFDKDGYNGFGVDEPEATLHIRQYGHNGNEKDGLRMGYGSSILNIYGVGSGLFHIDATQPLILNRDGQFVKIGDELWPSYPLHMASGAHVTVGGVWTDASSRDLKENIQDLTVEEAIAALAELTPKKYNYKTDKDEEYLGFIAEDVPDLVATNDRKSMSPMDVVALLTKIVQQQQKKIEELEIRISASNN